MMPARQASCVAIGGRAVLIEGAPGSGKSSLALALIDRGAELIGDDGVLVEPRGGALHALPHPNTRGLIEVRNVGIVTMPARDDAPVALALWLDEEAPRFIDRAETLLVEGISVPLIRLWPYSPTLALRAELALSRYGLELS